MFTKRTVFIVGAGCSLAFKFPLGSELRTTIHKLASNNLADLNESAIGMAFAKYAPVNGLGRLKEAQRIILDGVFSRPSIDQFLDYHSDKPDIVWFGKLLIATAIIGLEQRSPLRTHPEINGDWLEGLFHLACDNVSPQTISEMFNDLRVICFNYDRCIEFYLYRQVLGLTGGDRQIMSKIFANLKIIHPYGRVGPVPWDADHTIANTFGEGADSADILYKSASGLRTFTERMEPHADANESRFEMLKAKTIALLGFGYIPQNMELLRIEDDPQASIFANVLGVPNNDLGTVSDAVKRMVAWHTRGPATPFVTPALDADAFIRDFGGSIVRGT